MTRAWYVEADFRSPTSTIPVKGTARSSTEGGPSDCWCSSQSTSSYFLLWLSPFGTSWHSTTSSGELPLQPGPHQLMCGSSQSTLSSKWLANKQPTVVVMSARDVMFAPCEHAQVDPKWWNHVSVPLLAVPGNSPNPSVHGGHGPLLPISIRFCSSFLLLLGEERVSDIQRTLSQRRILTAVQREPTGLLKWLKQQVLCPCFTRLSLIKHT